MSLLLHNGRPCAGVKALFYGGFQLSFLIDKWQSFLTTWFYVLLHLVLSWLVISSNMSLLFHDGRPRASVKALYLSGFKLSFLIDKWQTFLTTWFYVLSYLVLFCFVLSCHFLLYVLTFPWWQIPRRRQSTFPGLMAVFSNHMILCLVASCNVLSCP